MDNSDAMDIDAPPPPPAQQRAEMLACDPAGSLVAGTHYYLVEQKWFNTWTDFSTAVENAEPPGPIDNEPLLEPVVANSATADAAALLATMRLFSPTSISTVEMTASDPMRLPEPVRTAPPITTWPTSLTRTGTPLRVATTAS